MLKLNKVSLEGYKSIKECRDLRLEKLNVLIGANGSGKSNFLSFFKLLSFEMAGALQEFIGRNGGRDSLLHFGAKRTRNITAELEATTELGTNSYRMRLEDAQPDTLIFTEESILFNPNGAVTTPNRTYLGVGYRESALHLTTNPILATVYASTLADNTTAKFFRNTLSRFQYYQFHDSSDQSRMRSRSDLRGPRHLLSDGANLAAHLHRLREEQPKCYQRVVETVRLVFPVFRDFVLEPDNGGGHFVMLRWKAAGSSEYDFGPHQISDGTLRFMALATLLLQPPDWLPQLITIDEPELGLHPYAIKILGSLIADAANFTQIIVATQSASFIDQVEPDDVIVTDMVDGASQFQRLSGEKLKAWLEEYTLSELWEKNIVGGRP